MGAEAAASFGHAVGERGMQALLLEEARLLLATAAHHGRVLDGGGGGGGGGDCDRWMPGGRMPPTLRLTRARRVAGRLLVCARASRCTTPARPTAPLRSVGRQVHDAAGSATFNFHPPPDNVSVQN